MMKILSLVVASLFSFNVCAAEINATQLNLSAEQNQKLVELKEKLKAEVQPIAEEVESGRVRIVEIEKKYFEAFWNILTPEQKQVFMKLNQQ